MRRAVRGALLALAALALAPGARAQLTLAGARCGELACALHQYCSPETSRCAPCADVCERTHHNYDAGLCVQRCQDYIHDLRYVTRANGGGAATGSAASDADIKSLQLQAKAALIVSSVLLALLLITCMFKCWCYTKNNRSKFTWKYLKQKWPLSKSRVKQYPPGQTHHNPHAEAAGKARRDLKLDIQPAPAPAPAPRRPDAHELTTATERSPRTVSTCVSSRHPAEDATLDYSYDNMALNVTPPPAAAAVQHF